MFTEASRINSMSGLYTYQDYKYVPPRGVLSAGVDTKDINEEKKKETEKSFEEEGPDNQEELAKVANLGYQASIQRAKRIEQLGGQVEMPIPMAPITKQQRKRKPPKTKKKPSKTKAKRAVKRKTVRTKRKTATMW